MSTESATKSAVGFLLVILVGALGAALLGGLFGGLLAVVSPEFASDFLGWHAGRGIVRYSFAVGMLGGLLIGAAVSCFACFLAAIIKIVRVHFEYRKTREADQPAQRAPQ